jgi:hypothetical protein
VATWFLLDDSSGTPTPKGPFDLDTMRSMAQVGTLRFGSQVARPGAGEWGDAGLDPDLSGLFVVVAAKPAARTSSRGAGASTAAPIAMASEYSFGAAFSMTVALIRAQPIPILIAGIIFFGLSAVVGLPAFISGLMTPLDAPPALGPRADPGSFISNILFVLIGVPAYAGACYAGAQAVRGELKPLDIFEPFKRYHMALLASVLVTVFYVLLLVLSALPAAACLAIAYRHMEGGFPALALLVTGVLVSITAWVYFLARYLAPFFFLPAVITDPKLGPPGLNDAVRMIWDETRESRASLFGFLIVMTLLAGLTIMLLCIGFPLIGAPLLVAAYGSAYALFFRQRRRQDGFRRR